MRDYLFDLTLVGAVHVRAASEEEARRMLEAIDANTANLGAWPNGDPILAEVSLDDSAPVLVEIDGEEI